MTFSKRDSALRDKAGSLWLASSIDTQVLSPCSPLHNPAFSSQILESQNGFTKQAQNLESTFQQSSHSPTAKRSFFRKPATAVQGEAEAGFFRIPRILEEENQANQSSLRADNALFPSLRDFALAKSWQSISAQADSSKASKAYFASAKFIDCHATATALARNDSKNAKTQKVDSRFFTQTAQSLSTPQGKKAESVFSNQPQAAGFCDDFGGFQGGGEGIYLSGNEQAPAAESAKSAQKPTPKAES